MFKLGLNPFYAADDVIAIGDIHAGLSKLQRLWTNLLPLNHKTHVVFAGDLLDRGTEVFEVLDFIINLKKTYPGQIFIIEGNHDRYLREFLYPEQVDNDLGNWAIERNNQMWVERSGGQTTIDALKSRYKTDSVTEWRTKLSSEGYWQVFEDMIPYYESATVFISHAPVDGFYLAFSRFNGEEDKEEFKTKLVGVADEQDRKLRNQFSEEVNLKVSNFEEFDLGKTFICGHQSSGNPEPRTIGNRVFLDVSNYHELYAYSTKSKQLISSKS